MTPTPEQSDILAFVRDSRANLLIKAGPGSGKTTTLAMIAKTLPQGPRHAALCFGRETAEAFSAKLPWWIESSTMHKLGKTALEESLQPRPKLSKGKCREILKDRFPDVSWRHLSPLLRTVSRMKSVVAPDPADFDCDVDMDWSEVEDILTEVLRLSDADLEHIDFDDMLRFAALLPQVRLPSFATLLVDEVQDTNEIQRALLKRLASAGARIIAVGDTFQSIYGFRGADHHAIDNFTLDFSCETLPLCVSQRCAVAICHEANSILNQPWKPNK